MSEASAEPTHADADAHTAEKVSPASLVIESCAQGPTQVGLDALSEGKVSTPPLMSEVSAPGLTLADPDAHPSVNVSPKTHLIGEAGARGPIQHDPAAGLVVNVATASEPAESTDEVVHGAHYLVDFFRCSGTHAPSLPLSAYLCCGAIGQGINKIKIHRSSQGLTQFLQNACVPGLPGQSIMISLVECADQEEATAMRCLDWIHQHRFKILSVSAMAISGWLGKMAWGLQAELHKRIREFQKKWATPLDHLYGWVLSPIFSAASPWLSCAGSSVEAGLSFVSEKAGWAGLSLQGWQAVLLAGTVGCGVGIVCCMFRPQFLHSGLHAEVLHFLESSRQWKEAKKQLEESLLKQELQLSDSEKRCDSLRLQMQSLKRNLNAAQEDVAFHQGEADKWSSRYEEAARGRDQKSRELRDVQQQLEKQTARADDALTGMQRAQTRSHDLESKLGNAKCELERLNKRLKRESSLLKEGQDREQKSRQARDDALTGLKRAESTISDLRARVDRLAREQQLSKQDYEYWRARCEELQKELGKVTDQSSCFESQAKDAVETCEALHNKLEKAQNQRDRANCELKKLERTLGQQTKEFEASQTSLRQTQDDVEKLRVILGNEEQKLANSERDVKALEESALDMEKSCQMFRVQVDELERELEARHNDYQKERQENRQSKERVTWYTYGNAFAVVAGSGFL